MDGFGILWRWGGFFSFWLVDFWLFFLFVCLFDLKSFTKTKESCEISRVWYEIKLSFVNAAQCLNLTNSNMHDLITLESIFRIINLYKMPI